MPPFKLELEKQASSAEDATIQRATGKRSLETVTEFIQNNEAGAGSTSDFGYERSQLPGFRGSGVVGFAVCESAESEQDVCAGGLDAAELGGGYGSGTAEPVTGVQDRGRSHCEESIEQTARARGSAWRPIGMAGEKSF